MERTSNFFHGELIGLPQAKAKATLASLLDGVTDDNVHASVDFWDLQDAPLEQVRVEPLTQSGPA